MGMHCRIMGPLRGMYQNLHRRFKLSSGVGKEFMAVNGILQGCPISVLLLNAVMCVWSHAVETEVPGSCAESYADGTQATADTRSAVTQIANVTKDFANYSGQV
eukprot:9938762-Karenia_brevis.AAC.1